MIAAIEIGQQLIGMIGIANYRVKIDYAIEMSSAANPLIHSLSIGFAHRAGMIII